MSSVSRYASGPEAVASGPSPIVGPTGLEPMTFWV